MSHPLDTELIVKEYFQEQLKRKGFVWPSNNVRINGNWSGNTNRLNTNRRVQICESLCSMSAKMFSTSGPSVVEMCERFSLPSPEESNDNWSPIGYQSFKGVANELFGEEIKWSHILTLFVFSSELAFLHGVSKGHLSVIDDVVLWLCLYVNDNVLHWINNHGGWEHFILYASGDEIDTVDSGPRGNLSLTKFIVAGVSMGLIGAVTAVGILFITKKLS